MLPDDTFKDMKQQNYGLFLFKTYLTVDKEFLCKGVRQSDKYNGKLFTATFFCTCISFVAASKNSMNKMTN